MATLFARDRTAAGYAQIAVERAVDQYPDGLTYAIPPDLVGLVEGRRVVVPLGRGDTPTGGYIVHIAGSTELDPDKVKFILRADPASATLPPDLIQLARWISTYYCAPIGITLAAMLPAAVKKNVGAVTRLMLDLGDPLPLGQKLPPKQRAALEALAALPGDQRPIELHALMERASVRTRAPITHLIERGLIDARRRTTIEATWADQVVDAFTPERLTDRQRHIVDEIAASLPGGFSSHLLYGVTGAGKTEVYIRLIERTLAGGRMAIMLVPEISLTPQTGGRMIGRFPRHRVAILHSGLTAAQRHQQWALVAAGEADIVLGARSAVFAPLPEGRLGLVIVDEEHDGSYKQDQAPRYHGRDVAVRRAQIAGCPVVLGSATPSLESWHNATARQTYVLHRLPERAPGLRLPRVQVLDFMAQVRAHHDRRVHLFGPALQDAIRRTLDDDGQVLLLLNRRGYANYIACPDHHCGWVMNCDHCDVTTVYHRAGRLPSGGYVQCHHCGAEQKLPATCPDCGRRIITFGLGTQRVEEELTAAFPDLVPGQTMLRIDSDAMHGSADLHEALRRFGQREIKLLVGTQMIAKGLDYPGVRLVGVINADTAINLPDFRATERTFQLVSQVCGRCGRSDHPGLAIVQTFNPDSPAIRLAAAHDYEAFAALELEQRRQSGLPPFSRMARIVFRDGDLVKCIAAARRAHDAIVSLAESSIRVRGPAPCPIARLNDKHRQQVEIIAPTAATLQTLISAARNAGVLRPGAAMAIDVDPVALL